MNSAVRSINTGPSTVAPHGATERLEGFILTILNRHFEMFRYERRLYDLIDAAIENDWPSMRNYKRDLAITVTAIVESGIRDGEFASSDPAQTSAAVLDCLTLLTHPAHIRELDEASVEKRARAQVRFLVRALH